MIKKKGKIELYSPQHEFVASRVYPSVKERNKIIESWKKKYPNRQFYVIIKPKDEDESIHLSIPESY